MKIAIMLLVCIVAFPALAQTQIENVELTALFKADQSARQSKNIDWQKLQSEDEQRRQQVRQMIDKGEVRTGIDYFHAALIFQHGQSADDFLFAHVLAMDATALGYKDARWLSAATLDRYLLTISRPQIFGTQFEPVQGKSNYWEHRKIDAVLLPDSARNALCVMSMEAQEKNLEEAGRAGTFHGTSLPNCK
ncbi:hypothetical protein ACOBR2_17330 [Telmatobacter bradus]|uniref:hypothetical protein n=1 Tax=Telmatobacter bradus TaxID=474953 RepID=UPI003B428DBD